MLASPLDVDAMSVTFRRERSDSGTQTHTVATGVTPTHTRRHTLTTVIANVSYKGSKNF